MKQAHITLVGKRLVLDAPYEARAISGALPGVVWDKRHRVWTTPATLGTAATIVRSMSKVTTVTRTDEVEAMIHAWRDAVAGRTWRDADDLPEVPSKTAAWKHQARGFHWGLAQEGALLNLDMGTGKSKVAVDLANAWQASPMLVLAGKRATAVWRKQFRLHSLADYHVSRGEVYSRRGGGLKKNPTAIERLEAFERDLAAHDPVAICINYELAWRDPFREWLLERRWALIITDEGHRARAPGGRIGQFVGRLRDTALWITGGRRLELTGTAMPHSPLDLYGQGRFIEPALFGTSFDRFKTRYGKPRVLRYDTDINPEGDVVQTPVYLLGPDGKAIIDGVRDEVRDELADKLGTISFHVAADDCLDLPRELDHEHEVTLGAAASKAYRSLERDLVADVAGGIVTADNALSRLLRLQQITSGHLPVERPCALCRGITSEGCEGCSGTGVTVIVETVDAAKQEALTERLQDLPRARLDPITFEPVAAEPVICFARFTHDLLSVQIAAEKAGRDTYRELSGDRDDAVDEDGVLRADVDVAGVQIKSGSEAIDFTRSRLTCYVSLGFELMPYKQSRARTRRPGADVDRPVEYVHFLALLDDGKPTVDHDVMAALKERQNVIADVLERMHRRLERDA